MHDLRSIGFDAFFEAHAGAAGAVGAVPARVAAEHRGSLEVWWAGGAAVARLAGRLRRDLLEGDRPAVGDWVLLRAPPDPGGLAVVCGLLPRRSVFSRGAAGRATAVQVVAANLDRVFVVMGLDADFNPRRLERYLAAIRAGGAEAAVVLNKVDCCPEAAERAAGVEARLPGVPVLRAAALWGEGVEAVRASIPPGTTAAFVGSSGAGKSTLLNGLVGGAGQATGPTRARDGRGRHVTTRRQLFQVPGAGLVVDTPGMRELLLAGDEGLGAVFADVAELALECRYRDCRHEDEPGCAVRAAIEAGDLAEERLEHHRKLEREAQAWVVRHDERQRRKAERAFGRMAEEVMRHRRRTRGGWD